MHKVSVVVPNWNGRDSIGVCIESLLGQTLDREIIIVENGSTDGSLQYLEKNFPDIKLVINKKNLGFAGGVNSGIRQAVAGGADYVALFNNDATADKGWLSNLVKALEGNKYLGIATPKLLNQHKTEFDSSGDFYTNWGLPFPRGRGEPVSNKYDKDNYVFAGSGGASLYRVKMLKEVGLFDEDFFAYYEDIDLSFRAQLAGWKVLYVPQSLVFHQIGATSSKIKGFTTYQTMKNLPWLLWKNVPSKYLLNVLPRFSLAYSAFFVSALSRGQVWPAIKGGVVSLLYSPKKFFQRLKIQSRKKVSDKYIWSIVEHDLPPNAAKLRNLRNSWWKITGRLK